LKTVDRANSSKLFLTLVIGTCVLLVVPFASGMTNYWTRQQIALLASSNIFAVAGILAGAIAVMSPPRFPLSLWLLILLMAVRAVDSFARGHGDVDFDPIISSVGALLFCIVLSVMSGNTYAFRQGVITSATIVLIFNSAMNYWEWSHPGYFSTVEGRSAGLLTNANGAAYSIALMLGTILAAGIPRAFAFSIISIAAAGIYFTLSRGGAISWILIVGVYILTTFKTQARSLATGLGLLGASGLIIYYLIASNDMSTTSADVKTRIALFSGQTEALDINDSSRIDVLMEGVDGIMRAPLSGYGTFSSTGHPFRPHNEFLAVWLDNGIVGIALFLSAISFLGWECYRARQPVLFVGYAGLMSTVPFSHSLLEDRSFMVCWVTCSIFAMAARKMRDKQATPINVLPAVAT
jgi:O-antigen ligase